MLPSRQQPMSVLPFSQPAPPPPPASSSSSSRPRSHKKHNAAATTNVSLPASSLTPAPPTGIKPDRDRTKCSKSNCSNPPEMGKTRCKSCAEAHNTGNRERCKRQKTDLEEANRKIIRFEAEIEILKNQNQHLQEELMRRGGLKNS